MQAICLTENNSVTVQKVPRPATALKGHVIIKMEACGINAGDMAFISGAFPKGTIPSSQYGICGVSGAGTIIAVGAGVPSKYAQGNKVTVYRSLKFSENIIGTWCEYAQLPFEHCAILPGDLPVENYAGSLVNIITPYAFLQQIKAEGHKGIICTAGSSATGFALLGICVANHFPLISIVRTLAAKTELEALGATHIIVQTDADYTQALTAMSKELSATAVFEGVGGEPLSQIIGLLPFNTTVYCYGYLGGKTPLTFHSSILMRGITLKGFSNFRTATVQDPLALQKALREISAIIAMPHFKTKAGKQFSMADIQEALAFASLAGEKAILMPGLQR